METDSEPFDRSIALAVVSLLFMTLEGGLTSAQLIYNAQRSEMGRNGDVHTPRVAASPTVGRVG